MEKKILKTKITKEGKDPKHFVSVFKKTVDIAATKLSKTVADKIRDEAIEILETQRYDHAELSPDYLDWKIKSNLDPRILIATGFYKDNIESWVDEGKAYVGVKPGVIHKPSGMNLVDLARIHEFGTMTIPARPLWRPLISKWVRTSKFKAMFDKAIKKAKQVTKAK